MDSRIQHGFHRDHSHGLQRCDVLHYPSGIVRALDATNGTVLWEYKRPGNGQSRSKNLAIFEDMIYFSAPDSYVVALDARTGALRWETKQDSRSHTSGPIIVEGKVISGGGGGNSRNNCYLSALDAKTGKEIWRFYTAAGKDDPEGEIMGRHSGSQPRCDDLGAAGFLRSGAPADLLGYRQPDSQYQNGSSRRQCLGNSAYRACRSLQQLHRRAESGHRKTPVVLPALPGDDWDEDINEERMLIRTAVNPDPRFVKWINPDIPRGQMPTSPSTSAKGAESGRWIAPTDSFCGPRHFLTTLRTSFFPISM